jgi:hypothetical protein
LRPLVWFMVLAAGVPAAGWAQGVDLGGGLGVVKPEHLGVGILADLELRVPVVSTVYVTAGIGGWHLREVDTVAVETGPGIFTRRALTYPVTDLALSVGLQYSHPVSRRDWLLAGGGASLHYLVSDLASLDIEGDSESRPGGYAVIGFEHQVAPRLGVRVATRFDLVSRVNHFRGTLGLRYSL